jgi:hypothetical protein
VESNDKEMWNRAGLTEGILNMSAYAVYWKNFAKDRAAGNWPCPRWYSNFAILRDLEAGDLLFLFASGKACQKPEQHAGYLVQLFEVESVGRNPGDNASYPADEFEYVISASAQGAALTPRLLVDSIVRLPEHLPEMPIGQIRQQPHRLTDDEEGHLIALIEVDVRQRKEKK